MKVLHVYRTYFPDTQGGLEEVIRQICRSSGHYAVESRVFALSRNPQPAQLTVDGVEVIRVKQSFEIASCGFCFVGLAEFRRQVAWADIVHYHFPWPYGDAMHMLLARHHPMIVTYHSDIVRQQVLQHVYTPLMTRFLQDADKIVATSPNYFSTSDVLKHFSSKVDVIPIGIDEAQYLARTPSELELKELRKDYGEGFFLFVGVLRYYKGLHILLEAMQNAQYRVVIVGAGPEEQALRDQAQRLQLDNVVFAGYVSDTEKMSLFQLCRGVVFPSYLRAEAFGVTLLEGAMSAKPLISAEVGSGTSHVNIHGETGLVVAPGCAAAVREAMDWLYYNPRQARAMGHAARQRYQRCFTADAMGVAYADCYQNVIKQRAGNAGRTSHSCAS